MEGIEELAQDIVDEGCLLNPIGVWQPPGKDYYVLNYGYRRLHALKWLKEHRPKDFISLDFEEAGKIPCAAYGGDLNAALIRNLSENLKRKRVNPADLVTRVGYLHEVRGMTETLIAKTIGIAQSQVSGMLGVHLGCSKAVIGALRQKLINLSNAKKFSKLPHEQQDELLEKLLEQDPEQAKKIKKLLAKKTEASVRPGVKTLKSTLGQVAARKEERDKEYRDGVIAGLKFALGIIDKVEWLFAPAHAVPEDAAPQAPTRLVRAMKPKKKFAGKAQEKETTKPK